MGRSSLETLRELPDREIDRLCMGLSGKKILFGGSFLKKAVLSGARISLVRPWIIFDLMRNLAKG